MRSGVLETIAKSSKTDVGTFGVILGEEISHYHRKLYPISMLQSFDDELIICRKTWFSRATHVRMDPSAIIAV